MSLGQYVHLLPRGAVVRSKSAAAVTVGADSVEDALCWARTGTACARLGLTAHDGDCDPEIEAHRAGLDREHAAWRLSSARDDAALVSEVNRQHARRRVFPLGARGLLALPSSVVRLAKLIHARIPTGPLLVLDDLDDTDQALATLGHTILRDDSPLAAPPPAPVKAALCHLHDGDDLAAVLARARARLSQDGLLFCTVRHPWQALAAEAAATSGFAAERCILDFQVLTNGHAMAFPWMRDLWVLRATTGSAPSDAVDYHVTDDLRVTAPSFSASADLAHGRAADPGRQRGMGLGADGTAFIDVVLTAGAFAADTRSQLLAGIDEALAAPLPARREVVTGQRWAAVSSGDGQVLALDYTHRARRLVFAFTPYSSSVEFAIHHALETTISTAGYTVLRPPGVELRPVCREGEIA